VLGLRVVDIIGGVAQRRVPGVAEVVREVGDLLAARFGVCSVRGEVSGFARAASGHCYFNLKDADGGTALIRCAMFRRASTLLAFAPADGHLVEARGRLGVYEPRGELQLVVEAMQRAGAGALYEQYLQTKARLQALGLFDPSRKRALPAYPGALGIVTSLGAAALHDVTTALARRVPHLPVVIYPSPVQGVDAPAAIAAAIATASRRAEVDTLIVCRGGGSLEDLWAFNDERVVRAIVAASMPVISGVGHETDVTLADFAADLRAPTPTAAAELAAPTRESCAATLSDIDEVLQRRLHEAIDAQAQRLDRIALRLSRPSQGVHQRARWLMQLSHRLSARLPHATQPHHAHLERLGRGLNHGMAMSLSTTGRRLDGLDARLAALDPKQVLARGYAWLSDDAGRAVVSTTSLTIGASLKAVLKDGSADVLVAAVQGRTPG
jgi:exodeoxyribonuclease VII large subunit